MNLLNSEKERAFFDQIHQFEYDDNDQIGLRSLCMVNFRQFGNNVQFTLRDTETFSLKISLFLQSHGGRDLCRFISDSCDFIDSELFHYLAL